MIARAYAALKPDIKENGMKDEHSRMLGSQCEDPTLVSSTFQVTVFGKRMDSSSKRHLRESSNSIPSSMTDARFVQSLLLATPLYFYYQHLTPPGYFSSLLKGLVHMRNVTEEPSVVLECGINLTRNSTIKPK